MFQATIDIRCNDNHYRALDLDRPIGTSDRRSRILKSRDGRSILLDPYVHRELPERQRLHRPMR
jgi:hypothetical protein